MNSLLNYNLKNILITSNITNTFIRNASKKTSGSTRNPKNPHGRPKHRGWKRNDGSTVTFGTILATQTKPRFFPGLNVGFGKDGTIYALTNGTVHVTCEKVNLNWDHGWISRFFSNRAGHIIYKKYFNVIPEKQHQRFRLIDEN